MSFSRTTVGGTYDPATATLSNATTSSESATGMYINKQVARALDGSVVDDTSVFVMLPDSLAKVPQDGDELTKDGATVKIENVRIMKSGETPVLYMCGVS